MNLIEKKNFIDALAALRTLQKFCGNMGECIKCPFNSFCNGATGGNLNTPIPAYCNDAFNKVFIDEVIE